MKQQKRVLIPAVVAAFVIGMGTSSLLAERHPQLRSAEGLLVKAQEHLMNAASDFGGHKLKAMEHIKAAVIELQEAIRFDEGH